MMNLKEIRNAYESVSGALSSVVRQVNFAGIAIIWIFVKDKHDVDPLLLDSSLFIVISMVLDVIQYFLSTVIWHFCYIWKHKKDLEDENIQVKESEWLNIMPWLCLYLKCIVTGIGYCYILRFLIFQYHL